MPLCAFALCLRSAMHELQIVATNAATAEIKNAN
jgi:hypothetical protein